MSVTQFDPYMLTMLCRRLWRSYRLLASASSLRSCWASDKRLLVTDVAAVFSAAFWSMDHSGTPVLLPSSMRFLVTQKHSVGIPMGITSSATVWNTAFQSIASGYHRPSAATCSSLRDTDTAVVLCRLHCSSALVLIDLLCFQGSLQAQPD